MDKGGAKFQGKDVAKGIDLYYNKFSNNEINAIFTDKTVEFKSMKINNSIIDLPILNWKDDLEIEFELNNLALNEMPHVDLVIFDKEQRGIANIHCETSKKSIKKGKVIVRVTHKNSQFSQGTYSLNIILSSLIRVHQY